MTSNNSWKCCSHPSCRNNCFTVIIIAFLFTLNFQGIFAELGLLKDIPATCNPSRDELLKESGARLTHDKVVVSGNIITSRAMGTAIPFGLAIVAHYLGENTARALGENILYYNA